MLFLACQPALDLFKAACIYLGAVRLNASLGGRSELCYLLLGILQWYDLL
jgi:hypothetical protein